MTKKTLPKGVTFIARTGRYKASIQLHGERVHLGYFATAEEAGEARKAKERDYGSKRRPQAYRGNEAAQQCLSSVAFADLLQYAEGETGGIIDTSVGSEFNIWCRAAAEARVDLKPASEFFSWLNEVVFDSETASAALDSPGPFVQAVRELQAAGASFDAVNAALARASRERRRATLGDIIADALGVADLV